MQALLDATNIEATQGLVQMEIERMQAGGAAGSGATWRPEGDRTCHAGRHLRGRRERRVESRPHHGGAR
jgi:hypothetical protein